MYKCHVLFEWFQPKSKHLNRKKVLQRMEFCVVLNKEYDNNVASCKNVLFVLRLLSIREIDNHHFTTISSIWILMTILLATFDDIVCDSFIRSGSNLIK